MSGVGIDDDAGPGAPAPVRVVVGGRSGDGVMKASAAAIGTATRSEAALTFILIVH